MRVINSHSGVSMRLLLLNNNPAVSRLIKLSAEKAGYELDEFEDYGLVPLTTYDVILVDNELYEESAVAGLREHTGCDYVVYICQRGAKKPEAMNVSLEKPFLPTDFLVLMDKIKNVIASHKLEEPNEEEPISQVDKEDADAFDIDKIDAEDDDMLPINLLEEHPDDFKEEEENSEKLTFDDLELDDLNLEDELFDSKTSDEKELSHSDDNFSFDDVEPLGKEDVTSFEDFDFEENEPHDTVNTLETEENDFEEEHNPSILDKDDINEVKQLLDESDENDDEKEIATLSLDALGEEDDTAGTFFFDEKETEEEPLMNNELLGIEEEDDTAEELNLEETALPVEEDTMTESFESESNTSVEENQEEIIDDFAEVIDEKIEEEKEQVLEEEALLPKIDVALGSIDQIGDIDSLDDLNETMLKQAFGEEIEENEVSAPTLVVPESKSQEIEVIRDEIESSIAKSISSLAQSDILREALKGMRLNISITFDEKE